MNRNIIKGGYATGRRSESAGFKFEAGALFFVPSYTENPPGDAHSAYKEKGCRCSRAPAQVCVKTHTFSNFRAADECMDLQAGFKFETKFFFCETVLLRKNADAIGLLYNGDIKQKEERSY